MSGKGYNLILKLPSHEYKWSLVKDISGNRQFSALVLSAIFKFKNCIFTVDAHFDG